MSELSGRIALRSNRETWDTPIRGTKYVYLPYGKEFLMVPIEGPHTGGLRYLKQRGRHKSEGTKPWVWASLVMVIGMYAAYYLMV